VGSFWRILRSMPISSMPAPERLAWTPAAWEDYLYWQGQDKRQLRRINQLIQACLRDVFVGIGKPEPLRENLSGCWSRRIDDEHRLIYRLEGTTLVILACRYHYR
jgi:toxin YoeB